jgi:hypothetical protein
MFLKQISGADLPVITDDQPLGPKEIMVGVSEHMQRVAMELPYEAAQPEGFVICTAAPGAAPNARAWGTMMWGAYAWCGATGVWAAASAASRNSSPGAPASERR